ncbi:CHAP domain-containing protein [Hymenobacter glacieicola]|uniref:Peptidase C51 domain-containing protein n=1 Tax=Hymenobacter glacieicola TaxID=1562124 RepID=A0ABQ1X9G2_9BACT|nr:CHAP domain-containing protein [Hymenobacter glacieicola]GGG60470.1 hypothetical protein GCM10011378_40590 [Hymenobacter glacieicola]
MVTLPAPQRLRVVYLSQVGVREATGRNDGARVEAYLREIGLPKGYQWCSAFCVWCFRQAGIKAPSYGMARSWFTPARLLYRQGWEQRPAELGHGNLRRRHAPRLLPQPGDLVGYRFSGSVAINHVGFLDSDWGSGPSVTTVEGNTNLVGSRTGNGVWRNIRHKRMIYALARHP